MIFEFDVEESMQYIGMWKYHVTIFVRRPLFYTLYCHVYGVIIFQCDVWNNNSFILNNYNNKLQFFFEWWNIGDFVENLNEWKRNKIIRNRFKHLSLYIIFIVSIEKSPKNILNFDVYLSSMYHNVQLLFCAVISKRSMS